MLTFLDKREEKLEGSMLHKAKGSSISTRNSSKNLGSEEI